jgi:hypothetical protein
LSRECLNGGDFALSWPELQDLLARVWVNLSERPAGPLAFGFLLQKAMSAALAVRDGVRDARQGTPPYPWSIVFDSGNRAAPIRQGLQATSKIILLAVVLDVTYQITVLEEFYPGEALIVGLTLGLVPYMLIPGLAARFARLFKPRGDGL